MQSYDRARYKSDDQYRINNMARNKDRRNRNARFIWDYLSSNPCPCGEDDPIVLEFDHRDPSDKKYNLSDMMRGSNSLATIEAEIAKCDVLCVKCHRRKTAKQFGWYSSIAS